MASALLNTACPVCMKVVLDSEKGIQCDRACTRWFHVSCIRMPDSTYNKYATNSNKLWQCDRVDCSGSNDQGQSVSNQIAEILKRITDLPTKSDLAAVSGSIDGVKGELEELRRTIGEFEPRLRTVEKRLDGIESQISQVGKPDDVIGEINDRARRANNILVYNIPELRNPELKLRVSHDMGLVDKLLKIVIPDTERKNVKVLRIGKQARERPRPMKIILQSESEVRQFFERFTRDAVSNSDAAFRDISVSRDRTPRERQNLNSVKDELEKRIKGGEKNLTIKYRNGVPTIMANNPKN